jgi:NADH-quinone oxidoreductase subunit L
LNTQELAALAVVLSPGLAALVAGLGQRWLGDRGAMGLTVFGILVSASAAAWLFFGHMLGGGESRDIVLARWIDIGLIKADWAIRIDALSVTMMFVVSGVSSLVHIYSIGYMAEDPHRSRFFAYLSLFTFAMLMLVTANNFLQMFFGWEGVGLASYLLIGFWYKKASANAAAIKAFVVNRVGDFGFALGLMALVLMLRPPEGMVDAAGNASAAYLQQLGIERFSSLEFNTFFSVLQHNALVHPWGQDAAVAIKAVTFDFLGQNVVGLEIAGLLLFMGAMGKSAQFFLHTWLPDAMEGHNGDGRGVPGVPLLAAVFRNHHRLERDHGDRRGHVPVRSHGRSGAERHQARGRIFHLFAAGLHVLRRRRGLIWRGDVPPVHARLLQGPAVPRRRFGDPRHAP